MSTSSHGDADEFRGPAAFELLRTAVDNGGIDADDATRTASDVRAALERAAG
jgi:hypothetical protein